MLSIDKIITDKIQTKMPNLTGATLWLVEKTDMRFIETNTVYFGENYSSVKESDNIYTY